MVLMRVVAGSLRGRHVIAPEGESTRPTTDRARQATFNSLDSFGFVDEAKVVDLFAGSGAMGIEALSRGAASCAFVERDRKALDAIRQNIATLELGERTSVISGDVMTAVVAMRNVDLVLADPPYDFENWSRLLEILLSVLAPGGVVVAESGREIKALEGWEILRSKRYGRAWVAFLQRAEV
ncbi:methyltransferase small [Actinomycetes bacterium]|nr:methyltransferase small [Actinomycetes bacterium]